MADLGFSINNNQFFSARTSSINIFINFNSDYSTNPSINLTHRLFPTIRTCKNIQVFNRQFNTQKACNKLEFVINSGYDEVLNLRIPYSVLLSSYFELKLSIEGILDKDNPLKKIFELFPDFFKDFDEE